MGLQNARIGASHDAGQENHERSSKNRVHRRQPNPEDAESPCRGMDDRSPLGLRVPPNAPQLQGSLLPQTEAQHHGPALCGYIDATGTVPASRQVLRDFCVASNLPWDKVDWSRFAWQQVGNGTVTIAYADGRVIPISIVIPPLPPSEVPPALFDEENASASPAVMI